MFVFHRLYLWLAAAGGRSVTGGVGGARLLKAPAKVTGGQAALQSQPLRRGKQEPLDEPQVILGVV